jgi:hypothetical protein
MKHERVLLLDICECCLLLAALAFYALSESDRFSVGNQDISNHIKL